MLKNSDYDSYDIICHCMQIKRCEVLGNKKQDTLKDIICSTGAGTVCSLCRPLLSEVTGQNVWLDAKIIASTDVGKDISLFTLEIPRNMQVPYPGQHLVIQGYIDNRWETRRYTIISYEDTIPSIKVMIKKEEKGLFSTWLHDENIVEKRIRVSQPVGKKKLNLADTKPLVCVAGGIGITPALSFIESLMKSEHARPIHLLHSISNDSASIYTEKLDNYISKNPLFSMSIHDSSSKNRLTKNDMKALSNKYESCDFHICGPSTFINTIRKHLLSLGKKEDEIHSDSFSLTDKDTHLFSLKYAYVGIVLFCIFLFQDIFNVKIEYLEILQNNETYKIYSGLFVLFFIVLQFIRPYNKASKKPHFITNTYKVHKFLGVLSPLIFYVHSTTFGVGYLLFLSVIYFSNFLIGIFNHERITNIQRRTTYYKIWLPTHIIFSMLSVTMIAIHIYIVGAY